MQRVWIGAGSVAGLAAVAMAAMSAHGLNHLEPPALRMARSALQIHGWHALALLAVGLWAPRGGRWADAAGAAFAAGLLLFCGAIYALALRGIALGPVAPIGGTFLMIGWALLGVSAIRPARL